ncbi:MAG TPA: DUF2017 family protein [Actinomycetota bacterium]|nr:DUF2017 family protein [Actinomycetota bacterium]
MQKVPEGLRVQLDANEADLLRGLTNEMRLVLEADIPDADPVQQRLFPRAHDDDEDEAAYQELVGSELKDVKLEALRTVERRLGSDGPLDDTLPEGEIHEWLRLINDIRLAIGTRLQVDEAKMDKQYDPDDPEAPALAVLHWLAWVQTSILEEMT